MTTRKFESGYSKLKKKGRVKLFVESQKGAMDKFIKINKKNELETTGESYLNEKQLKHDNLLDLDGLDLFLELNILKEIIGLENDKAIDILNYIKRINSFPNAYIEQC